MKRTASSLKRAPIKNKRRANESEVEFRGDERAAIEARSGGKCEAGTRRCTGKARVIHHRLMKSHGGMGNRDNGLHICTACHLHIHHETEEAYAKGWLIRGAAVGTGRTKRTGMFDPVFDHLDGLDLST